MGVGAGLVVGLLMDGGFGGLGTREGSFKRLKKAFQPCLSSPTGTRILLRPPLLSSFAISAMIHLRLLVFSTQIVWSSVCVSLKNLRLRGRGRRVEKVFVSHERVDQCNEIKKALSLEVLEILTLLPRKRWSVVIEKCFRSMVIR